MQLGPIFHAIGPIKIAARPGFHAFSGADVTGSFAGRGKGKCWKTFIEAEEDVILSLTELGKSNEIDKSIYDGLEKFVCTLYCPGTKQFDIEEIRCLLFRQKQLYAEKLPPTKPALIHAIDRAHYQAMIRNRDTVPNQHLPSFTDYGWLLNKDDFVVPIMVSLPPAPDAILELV